MTNFTRTQKIVLALAVAFWLVAEAWAVWMGYDEKWNCVDYGNYQCDTSQMP